MHEETGSLERMNALLDELRRGDPTAPGRLFAAVYDTLHDVARGQRKRAPLTDTLNTTALLHEAFIKLFGAGARSFADRAHFLAVAAAAMRQILIGHARKHSAHKRGGHLPPASFDEIERALHHGALDARDMEQPAAEALLALDQALEKLQQLAPRQSRIVECRFFAGLSIAETAAALDVSPATVKRDWSLAQAWLHREMQTAVDPVPPRAAPQRAVPQRTAQQPAVHGPPSHAPTPQQQHAEWG